MHLNNSLSELVKQTKQKNAFINLFSFNDMILGKFVIKLMHYFLISKWANNFCGSFLSRFGPKITRDKKKAAYFAKKLGLLLLENAALVFQINSELFLESVLERHRIVERLLPDGIQIILDDLGLALERRLFVGHQIDACVRITQIFLVQILEVARFMQSNRQTTTQLIVVHSHSD